jgi:putative lipoic acid-binding regulatory protein
LRVRLHAIVLRHAPTLDAGRVSERLSAQGSFLSVSYRLRAEGRSQVEALVAALKACAGVLMRL